MSAEQIKNHYVLVGEIDKFTKVSEYEMPYPGLKLDSEIITDHVKAEASLGIGSARLRLETIYRHKNEEDILIVKVTLNITSFGLNYNQNILKETKVMFLLDDDETIQTGSVIDYKGGESPSGMGLQETTYLEADFAFLSKLALANKIEYRITGKRGNVSEGEFNKSDLYKIKGFYNGLFDSEFMKDELLNQIKEEKEEEKRKKDAENKINDNDSKILKLCKQGKKLEAVKLQKDISGSDLAASKKYVEDLCTLNGIEAQSSTSKSNSSCFVITATMGDPFHPIVDEFRAYRDKNLLTNVIGRIFVNLYYKVGPYAASIIRRSEVLRKISFSFFVNPVYKRLKNVRKADKD